MRKLLGMLSYPWSLVADLFIMLAVASVVIRFSMDNDISEGWSWCIGIIASVAALLHLKFRHRIRPDDDFEIKAIHSAEDHRRALYQIDRLWMATPGTPAGNRLEVLAVLVNEYESNYIDGLKESPEPEHKQEEYAFIKHGEETKDA